MKERSGILLLFRLAISIAILAFLALIYWSFVLQEERLRSIEESLQHLEQQFQSQKKSQIASKSVSHAVSEKENNLLVQDPYFQSTLPRLLGADFEPKGTMRLATIGVPDTLHPFSQWATVAEWIGLCQGAVSQQKFGFYEILAQDCAWKMEERPAKTADRTTFWVYLRDDLCWQPLESRFFPSDMNLSPHFLQKYQVTAHDFQFYLDALLNPNVDVAEAVTLRFLLRDIEKIEVIDDLTFVVTAKLQPHTDEKGVTTLSLPYAARFYIGQLRPLARFLYQYGPDGEKLCPNDAEPGFYRTSSLWAQAFVSHFASRVIPSCGPWIFDGLNDKQIRFRRNPDYYSPTYALYEAVEVYFLDTPDAMWRDFVAQKVDTCLISPQNLIELEKYLVSEEYEVEKKRGNTIKRLDFLQRQYVYVAWNENKLFFQDKKVRQALTLAIDRSRLIHQTLNGQAVEVTGPFFYESDAYNKDLLPYPYDPEKAKLLLEQEGWYDSDGDGVLDKLINGKRVPFRFSLTYFVKNPVSKESCELIALFLKKIGIDCMLNGLDVADLSASVDDKSFDALMLAWALSTPPEDPRQLWHSEGAHEKGSSNLVGFHNSEVDHLIDELQFETDHQKRQKLYFRLHEIIYDEQPYTFLFSPKAELLWWSWINGIFIPKDRQDLVPGANVEQPMIWYSWLK